MNNRTLSEKLLKLLPTAPLRLLFPEVSPLPELLMSPEEVKKAALEPPQQPKSKIILSPSTHASIIAMVNQVKAELSKPADPRKKEGRGLSSTDFRKMIKNLENYEKNITKANKQNKKEKPQKSPAQTEAKELPQKNIKMAVFSYVDNEQKDPQLFSMKTALAQHCIAHTWIQAQTCTVDDKGRSVACLANVRLQVELMSTIIQHLDKTLVNDASAATRWDLGLLLLKLKALLDNQHADVDIILKEIKNLKSVALKSYAHEKNKGYLKLNTLLTRWELDIEEKLKAFPTPSPFTPRSPTSPNF